MIKTKEEIKIITRQFGEAAIRVKKAGGDGVEIHVIAEIPRNIPRAVDQAGINGGQYKDRSGKAHRNACHLPKVFAAIKGKRGQGKEHK